MTSLYLLLWIAGGILLQVALFLGVGFWRHWQTYQALRNVATELNIAVSPEVASHETQAAAAAWPGLRTFKVERKVQEDASAQICSFYLVPEDGKPLPPFLPGQFLTFQLDMASPTRWCPIRHSLLFTVRRAAAPQLPRFHQTCDSTCREPSSAGYFIELFS
jgi:hypothetical protein